MQKNEMLVMFWLAVFVGSTIIFFTHMHQMFGDSEAVMISLYGLEIEDPNYVLLIDAAVMGFLFLGLYGAAKNLKKEKK